MEGPAEETQLSHFRPGVEKMLPPLHQFRTVGTGPGCSKGTQHRPRETLRGGSPLSERPLVWWGRRVLSMGQGPYHQDGTAERGTRCPAQEAPAL